MNPYLTNSGRALLVATALIIASASIAGDWVLLLVGFTLVALMALSFHGMLPATLALERRLIDADVVSAEEGAPLLAGMPHKLKVTLKNRAATRLRKVAIIPRLASGLRVVKHVAADFSLPGHSALTADLEVVSAQSGRTSLHGFRIRTRDILGLFEVNEYVSAATVLKFVPDVVRTSASAPFRSHAMSRDRVGLHQVAQKGFGSELRELRDHQHGDPFRAIAWKATARTGRLMVKEYESELVLNSYVCLDISSTMRGGFRHDAATPTKLEHGIRLAYAFAAMSLANRDRVGLVTFDEKIYGHLKPRDGRARLGTILQHLVGTQQVVDEDLTEYGESEVLDLVARYLLVQERLDFRRRGRAKIRGVGQGLDYWSFSRDLTQPETSMYDTDLLLRWIQTVLPAEMRRLDDPAMHAGVLDYGSLTLLRRFCHLRGIEIPYRVETRLGQKERGLVQCLEEILASARDSHFILIVTDLCGVMNIELISRGLRLAQARRHKVAFVTPFTPSYVRSAKSSRGDILHQVFSAAEAEERRAIAASIEALGVPVLPIGPQESLPSLLAKLSMRSRRMA